MDVKAINESSKALMKATSSGETANIIIGILNELKIGVVANEDILRSTRIGVTVNKSKQHKNPEVARLAGEIVKKWRDDISKSKPGAPHGARANGASRNGTSSPAPNHDKSKSSSMSSVPPDQRSWKKDKVKISHTNQAARDNCIGLMYDGLVHLSNISSAIVLNTAVAIEAAAYHTHGPEDKESYKSKMRSLYQNLKNKSNPSLRVRVLNGDIKPDQFVVMSHDELKSAERREEDKKIESENMRAAQAPQAEKSISTSLTCGKCGQKKVSYSQAQTRSADEPMTTFCECTVCGKRWKVSIVILKRNLATKLTVYLVCVTVLRVDLSAVMQRWSSTARVSTLPGLTILNVLMGVYGYWVAEDSGQTHNRLASPGLMVALELDINRRAL